MIKFDTLDKKPNLFSLLIAAVVTAAALAILAVSGAKEHAAAECAVFLLFCVTALVILIRTLILQLRYNPYSYNTVFYFGFALFDFSVVVTFAVILNGIVNSPALYTAASIPLYIVSSAKLYMILSFPFILIFSVGLVISNISLIRHEGVSVVNILGILLAFLLVATDVFLYFADFAASGNLRDIIIHELFTNLIAAVYLYVECMIIGVIAANAVVCSYEPDRDRDFLIILGCALRQDGTPSPLLQGRIDRALSFYRKQLEETGKPLIFITSGGQGPDEVISESESMKRYLMEHGIPEDRIIKEDQSTNTFENMKFSKEKIITVNPIGKVAFSTTNYHVFRSGIFARRVKMRAQGMSAKTKWYFWPNAAVREFIGLLTQHRGKQALIIGGIIVFYTVMTLFAYSV